MGFFKSFTQKVNYQSRFNSKPTLDHQLLNINNIFLDIKGYLAESHLAMGWIGIWITIVFFIPAIIYLDYGLISTIISSQNNIDWNNVSYTPMLLISLANIAFLALGFGWSWWNIKDLKKTSPIRFNRETQKVQAIIMGHLCEADWQNIKAGFAVQRMAYGYVVETRDVVRFYLKSTKNPGKEFAAVIQTSNSLESDFDGCKMVWEYLRHFMFEGPDQLPIIPANKSERVGQFQQASYTPKQALERRWFWPIYSANDTKDDKIANTLFWPIKVVLFVPNLLTDMIWHWMLQKLGGGFAKLPDDTFEDSATGCISPLSLNKVIRNDEEFLTFTDAKQRLADMS